MKPLVYRVIKVARKKGNLAIKTHGLAWWTHTLNRSGQVFPAVFCPPAVVKSLRQAPSSDDHLIKYALNLLPAQRMVAHFQSYAEPRLAVSLYSLKRLALLQNRE